jgi:hypothetical protein
MQVAPEIIHLFLYKVTDTYTAQFRYYIIRNNGVELN